MYKLSDADLVWNRACARDVEPLFAGDRALAALLLFHNLAMNGGFLHAIECLQPDEREAARRGYQFFGFDDVAGLILEAPAEVDPYADGNEDDSLDASLWERYTSAIPDDDALSARFKRHFLRRRSDFAPL